MSSIRRTDILTLSGLRHDGRKPHEIRKLHMELQDCNTAVVSMGLSTAMAKVTGPTDCLRRSDEHAQLAIVEVSLHLMAYANATDRRTTGSNDRRVVEMTRLIQQALEATLLLSTFPKARILVEIHVLADDGGRLTVALNAASLALMEAGIPMKDFLCACAAGYSNSNDNDDAHPLIDLNRKEEMRAVVVPCAILPQRGTLVMATLLGEPVQDYEAYQRLLEAAADGCRTVFEHMQEAVKERAATILSASTGHARLKVAQAV